MAVAGFREMIDLLEKNGELVRVKKEVDHRFELSAVAKKLEGGPALFFEKVRGYSMPVVVNTDYDRGIIARALGTTNPGLIDHYSLALKSPLDPVKVAGGPVKEVIRTTGINLFRDLPIPVHYEKDGGPYITTGLVVAELPENNIRNVSYQRLQATGEDELRLLIQPRHLWAMYGEREKQGRPLEVAVVIGNDTACRLAGATWGAAMPLGRDEFSIAGALRGRPVDLVRCETIGVWVPAGAEIVIEGEILPGLRLPEGPFAEFTGNYGDPWDNPVIKVKAITHRREAIYHDLLTFSPEHHLLLGLPYEPVVFNTVKALVPGTLAAHVTPASCGKFHAVVQIKKQHQGDGKDAIIAALSSVRDIKLVTVVDADVDPFNPRDVEWAVATRFQADRDLVLISGAKGNELDPSCPSLAVTAKMGLDATKPLDRSHRFDRITIPGYEGIDIKDYIL